MDIYSVLNPEEDDHQSQYDSPLVSTNTSPSIESREVSRSPECNSSNRRISVGNSGTPSYSYNRERREFRPTYQQEEERFIWYHRVDLAMDWPDVRNAYNTQFPGRQRRGFQGIQCKYYRCCQNHGIPPVRSRDRTASMGKTYGLRARLPSVWYPWMRREPENSRDDGAKL